MPDNQNEAKNVSEQTFENNEQFNDSVCIDASRIYDSCADKDCLSDLPVFFLECDQNIIDRACTVRLKDVEVHTVYIGLEPVPFHRGFYTVEMTFFFKVTIDVYPTPTSRPECIRGLSMSTKKVVLYGSEGNVRVFSSDRDYAESDGSSESRNLPKASVQVASPIGLDAVLKELHHTSIVPCYPIPTTISEQFGGEFVTGCQQKTVLLTVGLFTIVQIERNVQMLIPAYDFCVPEKECVESTNDPCEMFSRIDFPTAEFFPPNISDIGEDNLGCGCK